MSRGPSSAALRGLLAIQRSPLTRLSYAGENEAEYVPDPTAGEAALPWYRWAAEKVLTPLATVTAPLRYAANTSLAGLGRAKEFLWGEEPGTLGGGYPDTYQTILGPAPTGREFIGLGRGEKGRFELADLAGLPVEVAADPSMWLGFGGLNKAGKALKLASGLARDARVAAEAGDAAAALAASQKLSRLGELADIGRMPGLVARGADAVALAELPPLAERVPLMPLGRVAQAQAGLRQGLSVGLPFSDTARLGLRPGPLSRAVLGAADVGSGIANYASAPLRRLLSPSNRLIAEDFSPALREQIRRYTGIDPVEGMSTAVDLARAARAAQGRLAVETALPAAENLGRIATTDAEGAAAALRAIDEATQPYRDQLNQHFSLKLAEAEAAGNAGKAANLRQMWTRELNSLNVPWRSAGPEAVQALAQLAQERGAALSKFDRRIADLTDATAQRVARRTAKAQAEEASWRARMQAAGAEAASGFLPRDAAVEGAIDDLWGRTRALNDRDTMHTAGQLIRLEARRGGSVVVNQLVPDAIRSEAARLEQGLGRGLAGEQAAGVRIAELADQGLGYATHLVNPAEAAKAAAMDPSTPWARVFKDWTTTNRFALARAPEWKGLPATVVNDLWRAAGGTGPLFIEDPAAAAFRRIMAGGPSRAGASLAQGAVGLFAMPRELAGEGAVAVARLAKDLNMARVGGHALPMLTEDAIAGALKNTKYADAFVPKPIADALLATHAVVNDPASGRAVLEWINKASALYRLGATQLFPAFHVRNETSNWFTMWLGGLRNPAWLLKGAALQRRVHNRLLQESGQALRAGAKIATDGEMATMREAVQYAGLGDVLGRRAAERFGAVLPARLAGEAGGAAQETLALIDRGMAAGQGLSRRLYRLAATNPLARAGVAAGTAIENNAKIAMYLWARNEGRTALEAGQLVKKFLFDYGDLSRLEKGTIRQLAFFYTYQRKIWPLLFDELLTKPRRVASLGWLTGEMGSRAQGREKLPPWIRNRAPLGLGRDELGHDRYLSLGLPYENLADFAPEGQGIGRSLGKLIGNLTPPLLAPLELATGKDLRTGLDLHQDAGVQALLGTLPPRVRGSLAFLPSAVALSPLSRTAGTLNDAIAALAGDKPLAATASRLLAGGGISDLTQGRNALRYRLDQIGRALTNYEDMGLADSQRAKGLRTLRGRLRREIRLAYPKPK